MKRYIVLLTFMLVVKNAFLQEPVLHWARVFLEHNEYNPSIYSNGRSVAVDREGNVYTAGLFNYTTDFDPGPGIFPLTADNWAETGIYISKLSADGDFIWAIQVPALVEFGNIEIRLDKNDNVYLASELRDPTDMDPGPGVHILTPIGAWDAFVAKYDTDGKLVWAKQFGGPGDTVPRCDNLEIDDDNNVIICGSFNRTVDFDPGPGVYNLTSTAHIQAFIAKLNANGEFIWAKQFGHSPQVYSGSSITDVACDKSGDIYLVGNFAGICDFDPGPGTYSMQATGMNDGFITRLNSSGDLIWARQIRNTTDDYYDFVHAVGIDIDDQNNVYTTGSFIGIFDFDPGPGTKTFASENSYDWYVLKLNSMGEFEWADVFGGTDMDTGSDVVVDKYGTVYAIGTIGNVADMDPGPSVHTITTVNQYGASALVKLHPNGTLNYAGSFESFGTDYSISFTRRMALDDATNIYITGYFSGIVDFDPGPGEYPLTASSDQAPFVMKLGRCKTPTYAELTISTCNEYTLNNEIFDSSGVYIRTMPNSVGCDSIITLRLTINKRFSEKTIAICEGESFFVGGASQIVSGIYRDTIISTMNCDSIITTYLTVHPKPLPDLGPDRSLCEGTETVINPGSYPQYLWHDMSTANNFTANEPGLYWVKVTDNVGCSAIDSFSVESILPSPSNFLKQADSICQDGGYVITPSATFNRYQWSTGSNDRMLTVNQPGEYKLEVTDAHGCTGKESITLYRKECTHGVFIPTAFTPGNDGKNDIFRANVFGNLVKFKLQIFDRAGQLVFQTTDPGKGWDGTNRGQEFPSSVFVWQCFYQFDQQKPVYKKGTVSLLR